MERRSQALAVYLHQTQCSDIGTPCLGAFGVSCKTPLHVTTAQTEGTPKAGVLQVRYKSPCSSCPPFLKCFCQLFTDLFHRAQGKRGHWGVLPCSGHFSSSQDRLWGRHKHLCFGRLAMGSFKKRLMWILLVLVARGSAGELPIVPALTPTKAGNRHLICLLRHIPSYVFLPFLYPLGSPKSLNDSVR